MVAPCFLRFLCLCTHSIRLWLQLPLVSQSMKSLGYVLQPQEQMKPNGNAKACWSWVSSVVIMSAFGAWALTCCNTTVETLDRGCVIWVLKWIKWHYLHHGEPGTTPNTPTVELQKFIALLFCWFSVQNSVIKAARDGQNLESMRYR